MRTYDEESRRPSSAVQARLEERGPLGAEVARLAAARQRPDVMSAAGIRHLQRVAGNQAVGDMLEEQQSPVLGVVGKGGGTPLDAGTRSEMESAMGQDFSGVRVHTGGEASRSAASVQAQAYTVGNDVVFGAGGYDPGSAAGKRMLAHELTHVVQQRSGAVDGTPQAGGISVSDPSDRFERAAEHNADRVMSAAVPTQRTIDAEASDLQLSPAPVQRQEEDEEEV